MKKLSLLFLSMAILSCSSKVRVEKSAPPQSIATNTVGTLPPSPTSFYFADIQILTETSPEGDCSEGSKLSDDMHQDWKASLDEKNQIKTVEGADFKYFASNVNVEAIGFDTAKYSFSVLDGIMPKAVPFKMRLRRTPGQVLELHFLDQVVPMKLLTTPVYTFSATETRGSCTIKHNVNVFAERVGYFKRFKAE